jgi:hypothetical protein
MLHSQKVSYFTPTTVATMGNTSTHVSLKFCNLSSSKRKIRQNNKFSNSDSGLPETPDNSEINIATGSVAPSSLTTTTGNNISSSVCYSIDKKISTDSTRLLLPSNETTTATPIQQGEERQESGNNNVIADTQSFGSLKTVNSGVKLNTVSQRSTSHMTLLAVEQHQQLSTMQHLKTTKETTGDINSIQKTDSGISSNFTNESILDDDIASLAGKRKQQPVNIGPARGAAATENKTTNTSVLSKTNTGNIKPNHKHTAKTILSSLVPDVIRHKSNPLKSNQTLEQVDRKFKEGTLKHSKNCYRENLITNLTLANLLS